ncbi:MAG: choice-of-anchor J domain-containing protein, partial [Kiritimatiellae bacterium]|nr:choice-of-anchor J domain-containing protein [Kiritimatiellia bacterium]
VDASDECLGDGGFYYGLDGNAPAGMSALFPVVLHEIAHGLNFSGTMEYTAGTGEWGYGSGYPGVYDTFIKDAGGVNLVETGTYPNPSSALGTALTSESIWFHGPAAMAANGGQRVKIYAPSTWIGGSSYSHLDEATFAGTVNRLMVYSIPSGISIHDPGPVTSGMLTDMGWVLNNPNYPSNFIATTIDKFSIGLAWQKNSGDDDVLVAWSTNGTFGTPSGTYIVGNSISGGGTVLYKGSSTNKVHTGLTMGTEYFYKVWSDLSGGEYSLGKNAFAMTDYILSEGFENGGSVPSGWSHSYVVGTVDWEYRDGDGFSVNPAAAHSGSYNAYFYYDDYVDYKTKLITPEIDFGTSTTNTELKFWHYMEAWEGDQDELRVFYKTSAGGAWNQIATYTNTVSSWTEQTIMLPDANSTYYVAFEGNAMYGYGVCVDDITITGEELPLSTNSITASVVGDGAISPSGTVSVVEGGMTNFIITADARRHIASIQTNGAHIAGSPYSDNAFVATNYLWSNITMSGTIIASFDVNAIDVIIADIVTSNSNVIVEWVSSNGWLYMCES